MSALVTEITVPADDPRLERNMLDEPVHARRITNDAGDTIAAASMPVETPADGVRRITVYRTPAARDRIAQMRIDHLVARLQAKAAA